MAVTKNLSLMLCHMLPRFPISMPFVIRYFDAMQDPAKDYFWPFHTFHYAFDEDICRLGGYVSVRDERCFCIY